MSSCISGIHKFYLQAYRKREQAKHFDERMDESCKENCDVCRTPEAVKEALKSLDSKEIGTTFGAKTKENDDSELYGGGRKGYVYCPSC